MAQTTSQTITSTVASPVVKIRHALGDYKEQAAGAKTYNKKLEEEGDANRPKANVIHAKPFYDHLADGNAIVYQVSPDLGSRREISSSGTFRAH